MKLQTLNNCYRSNNNNKITVDPVTMKIEAYSYDWRKYVATDSVGNIIFNGVSYSVTTSKHHSDARSILRRLNLRPALELGHTQKSISLNIKETIKDEISAIKLEQARLLGEMKVKGSHKRKNAERQTRIDQLNYRIKDLERFASEILNKVKLKVKRDVYNGYWSDETIDKIAETVSPLFLKPNGVVQRNELNEFVKYNEFPHGANELSETVANQFPKIMTLFGLKPIDRRQLILYRHIVDIERGLPEIDSDDWLSVVRWCKSMNINRSTLNLYQLDRLHTYQINRQNKRVYEPRPEVTFSYPTWLGHVSAQLEEPDQLTILDSARKLRAEGKRQSHCIGSDHYIKSCERHGYFALNYKGYTFYFAETDGSQPFRLVETSGKHNAQTPQPIAWEITVALNAAFVQSGIEKAQRDAAFRDQIETMRENVFPLFGVRA